MFYFVEQHEAQIVLVAGHLHARLHLLLDLLKDVDQFLLALHVGLLVMECLQASFV
jgi:hypothetical protein